MPRKTKKRKSKSKNKMTASGVLMQKKLLIPLVVVAVLIVYFGGFTPFSALGIDGYEFDVKYSTSMVDGTIPQPNGVTVSTALTGVRINADGNNPVVLSGASFDRDGTGYSPVHVGIGTWRSVYQIEGVDFITNIGDEAKPYTEVFEGGTVIRTYQLLMEILVVTEAEENTVATASTLAMTGGSVSNTVIPAVHSQTVHVEFDMLKDWVSSAEEGVFQVVSIDAVGGISGIVRAARPSGGIIEINLASFGEPYDDHPYISPIIDTEPTVTINSAKDTLLLDFEVANGVVDYDGTWLDRTVEYAFDAKITVQTVADEFTTARLILPSNIASPVSGINLFGNIPFLGIEGLVIVIIVIGLIIFGVIYWKTRGWFGRKGSTIQGTRLGKASYSDKNILGNRIGDLFSYDELEAQERSKKTGKYIKSTYPGSDRKKGFGMGKALKESSRSDIHSPK